MKNRLEAYNNVVMARNIMEDKGSIASQQFVDSLGASKILDVGVMIAYIGVNGFEQVRKEMILG